MPRDLITATLRITSPPGGVIDADSGTIRGCKIMQLGAVATFKSDDGKARTVKITSKHIDALMAHAGNRAIPSHYTHDWFDAQDKAGADTIELQARVGAFKNFRKDAEGSLIADAILKDGASKSDILWSAEHNPEDMMLSAVFSYSKTDSDCVPVNFRAVDFVPQGAATTALFSQTQNTDTMTAAEFAELLKTPEVKTALLVAVAPEKDEKEAGRIAAMEKAAGVTDEDKSDEDKDAPEFIAAMSRCSRAIARQCAALKADRTAILADAKIQSAAEATALLGKGGFIKQGEGGGSGDELETAIASQISAGAKDRSVAIFRIAKDKPELYNSARLAGKV